MDDLPSLLDSDSLLALRAAYAPQSMLAANVAGVAQAYPRFRLWNEAIASTFYAPDAPLAPVNRERCLIGMLALTGPSVPFAVHVYWGLMEGVSVDEVCQIVGLAGCYGGLPRTVQSLLVLQRLLQLLQRLAGRESTPTQVLGALIQEFGADA